jgi:hypothetical protein
MRKWLFIMAMLWSGSALGDLQVVNSFCHHVFVAKGHCWEKAQ